jgi:1D-myo-inositol-triphosphate 3-kinase
LRNIVQWTPFFQTYKKQRYPWVQLAGHQGNFKAGPDQGTILKKLCVKEEKCFKVVGGVFCLSALYSVDCRC